MTKHEIYYISNAQSTWRHPPPFPFDNDKNYQYDFNIMTIEGLHKIPKTGETMIQEICVCSRAPKYNDGYGLIRIPSYHLLPFTPAFAIGKPATLYYFAMTNAYKSKIPQHYTPDPKTDLCKIALRHGVLLSEILNYDKEFALYAIKQNPKNINFLPDEIIDDDIREYIKKVWNINKSVFEIRPILIAAPPVSLVSPVSPSTDIKTKQIAKDYVKNILTTDLTFDTKHNYLFDFLYVVRDVFIEWLRDYKELEDTCTFRLDSIGYCDEKNILHPQFKKHLYEKSKQRLNITKACCVKTDSPQSLEKMINEYPYIFDFFEFLGFDIHVYMQTFWRRGRDINIENIKNKDEWINANYISVFLINPDIPDTCNEETRLGDGLCMSD